MAYDCWRVLMASFGEKRHFEKVVPFYRLGRTESVEARVALTHSASFT